MEPLQPAWIQATPAATKCQTYSSEGRAASDRRRAGTAVYIHVHEDSEHRRAPLRSRNSAREKSGLRRSKGRAASDRRSAGTAVYIQVHEDSEHRRALAARSAVASSLIFGDKDLPLTIVLRRTHDPLAFHLLDEPCGAVVADTQLSLNTRNRCPTAFKNVRHGLVVKLIRFVPGSRFGQARRTDLLAVRHGLRVGEHSFQVLRLTLGPQPLDHAVHFVVVDEGAVDALGQTAARRQIKHVAVAQQVLGALLVEDRARIDS